MKQLASKPWAPDTLLEPDIIVSAQGQRERILPCLPERRLMAAILERALDDLTHHKTHDGGRPIPKQWVGKGGRRRLKLVTGPRHYFLSHDRDWLYAFENVCDHLGLRADDVRTRLRRKGLL